MLLSKREMRQRWSQLRDLMCEWDPIGIMDNPDAPRDEYDCMLGSLLTRLQSAAPEADIAIYLRDEIVNHFGLSSEHHDFHAVAKRVKAWFDHGWREVREPETIYVALLNEGVDVWRPVQARPLGTDLFRIVGVDADVRDESWQFPAGAIVRCETRQFSGNQVGLTAVERREAG
jgi:hypothetical protein